VKNPGKWVALLAVTLALVGCGRTYHIVGRVVTVPGLDLERGFVAEITGRGVPSFGEPLRNVEIRLIHEIDAQGRPVNGTVWQNSARTDQTGSFEIQDYATPGKHNLVGLEFSASGFETLFVTYWDCFDVEPQEFFVVLRPQGMDAEADI